MSEPTEATSTDGPGQPPEAPSPRTQVRRRRDRGHYDAATVHAVFDAALVSHVGIVADGAPLVIPMLHGRIDGALYLHGSVASRLARALGSGVDVCVTATVVDGLVLARSAFHHSMNYRSVVALGHARPVDGDEKLAGLRAIAEHLTPGRWDECRAPNEVELRQTAVLRLDLTEASAKVRTGGPIDDEADLALPVWAGVLPARIAWGEPEAAADLAPGVALAPSVAALRAG